MLGADRVIAIDRFDYRLDKAQQAGATDLIDYEQVHVATVLKELRRPRGPPPARTRPRLWPGQAGGAPEDRASTRPARGDHELPQRRHRVDHGRLRRLHGQVPDRLADEQVAHHQDRTDTRAPLPAPAARAHPNREIDPSFVVSHHLSLDDAPHGYEMFKHKQDNCTKVVLKPWARAQSSVRAALVAASRYSLNSARKKHG
jgi:hypothetical protein